MAASVPAPLPVRPEGAVGGVAPGWLPGAEDGLVVLRGWLVDGVFVLLLDVVALSAPAEAL